MAKKKRLSKRGRKRDRGTVDASKIPGALSIWQAGDGLHAMVAGERPSEEKLAEMTRAYQQQIRKSPLFKEWVARFGRQKALALLSECRVELR